MAESLITIEPPAKAAEGPRSATRVRRAASYEPASRIGPVILVMPDTGEGLDQITPPLGTLAIAGVLEREGIPFAHIDQRMETNAERIILDLIGDGALCLAMGFQTGPPIAYAIKISQAVKAQYPRFPIIWAGWHPSILPEQTLAHPAVDILVRGQGEMTMLEVVQRLRDGQSMEGCLGVGYKTDGKVILAPDRPMVDLNRLPYMAYHLVDLKNYPGPSHRRRSVHDRYTTFRSSQGCPWRCAYCADPLVFDRRWKPLTAERTVDELQNLVENHGITYVDFVDDTFIVDPNRTIRFAKEMIKRKVPLKWSACARTGMIARLEQSTWDMLAEAGCDLVHPGVEVADQEMLDYILKDEENDNTVIAAQKLHKAGISGLYAFMISFPEEPPDMAEKIFRAIKQLKEIDPNSIAPVNFYVPYPGNVLFDRSQEKGFNPPASLEGWIDFGTRAGRATPWITDGLKDKIMKLDKFYLPAAYPSRFLKHKMEHLKILGWVYWLLHKIARFRVEREWYGFDLDWKLLRTYWRFWEKYHRRIRLHNFMFR